MEILVIVNAGPWGSSLSTTACRFVKAAVESGQSVPVVFFHDDGVYNAMPGRMADDGVPAPQAQWAGLGDGHEIELLLCSAAAARRLTENPAKPFREAGLAEMFAVLERCDRVVSF